MKTTLATIICSFIISIQSFAQPPDNIFNVLEYKAVADTNSLSTTAIQSAIDACTKAGGGAVYFPPGNYLTGTIILKNNVRLFLEAGATVFGSKDLKDYKFNKPSYRALRTNTKTRQLIYAEDVHHIGITGHGEIDGQGSYFKKSDEGGDDEGITRPHLIQFVKCNNVLIENISLKNSGAWMQHYLACDYLTVRGIKVLNHNNYNNDMLDIDGCKYVTVSDCIGDTDDDAIVLKSTSDRACENISITNCILSSHTNALKMGTESNGGFKNITISNCVIKPSIVDDRKFYGMVGGISGISLEIVDGGVMDGIAISNIRIQGTASPIFIRLGNRARPFKEDMPKPRVGQLKNVTINNIVATEAGQHGCSITGIPGHYVENVSISDVQIKVEEPPGKDKIVNEVPEKEAAYPNANMFGILPSYGFFVRHVNNITFSNVSLSYDEEDTRPAMIFDDVQDLSLNTVSAESNGQNESVFKLHNVQKANIQNCVVKGKADSMVSVTGPKSQGLNMNGNHKGEAKELLSKESKESNE